MERAFQAAAPKGWEISVGQWIEFEDKNGKGCAQPDIILKSSSCVLVFEVKLSYYPGSESQLHSLYMPLLEMIEGKPTKGILLYSNPAGHAPRPQVSSLQEIYLNPDRILFWPALNLRG